VIVVPGAPIPATVAEGATSFPVTSTMGGPPGPEVRVLPPLER
jgi:hypothetical protein